MIGQFGARWETIPVRDGRPTVDDRKTRGMAVRSGVFDHLDGKEASPGRLYEERPRLIEGYDRAGHAYHLADHHGSPLGIAPSPRVFLASVTQRTSRLRFGPLVFAPPLHDPLRLVDEICILDHLESRRIYDEALEVILKGPSRAGQRHAFPQILRFP